MKSPLSNPYPQMNIAFLLCIGLLICTSLQTLAMETNDSEQEESPSTPIVLLKNLNSAAARRPSALLNSLQDLPQFQAENHWSSESTSSSSSSSESESEGEKNYNSWMHQSPPARLEKYLFDPQAGNQIQAIDTPDKVQQQEIVFYYPQLQDLDYKDNIESTLEAQITQPVPEESNSNPKEMALSARLHLVAVEIGMVVRGIYDFIRNFITSPFQ